MSQFLYYLFDRLLRREGREEESFLLLETGAYLLLEDGARIIL